MLYIGNCQANESISCPTNNHHLLENTIGLAQGSWGIDTCELCSDGYRALVVVGGSSSTFRLLFESSSHGYRTGSSRTLIISMMSGATTRCVHTPASSWFGSFGRQMTVICLLFLTTGQFNVIEWNQGIVEMNLEDDSLLHFSIAASVHYHLLLLELLLAFSITTIINTKIPHAVGRGFGKYVAWDIRINCRIGSGLSHGHASMIHLVGLLLSGHKHINVEFAGGTRLFPQTLLSSTTTVL
mmetsp:Transcript_16828/g.41005  ORF Transcript_16828/g.41005 Transcript_16828/m.41005 type:complete len:241 (-) Transcript_16828:2057-2779(-)